MNKIFSAKDWRFHPEVPSVRRAFGWSSMLFEKAMSSPFVDLLADPILPTKGRQSMRHIHLMLPIFLTTVYSIVHEAVNRSCFDFRASRREIVSHSIFLSRCLCISTNENEADQFVYSANQSNRWRQKIDRSISNGSKWKSSARRRGKSFTSTTFPDAFDTMKNEES